MDNIETRFIGNFDVQSGEMIISDPCYDTSDSTDDQVINVESGTWSAYVDVHHSSYGDEVARLRAHHDSNPCSHFSSAAGYAGVDSGQLGFFDLSHYRDDTVARFIYDKSDRNIGGIGEWYAMCCEATLGDPEQYRKCAGVVPFGVVSSSGCGDGIYPIYTMKNSDGLVVFVEVVFIDDMEEGR